MTPGPQKGRGANGADGLSFVEKATRAWGAPLPEWVEALAQLADAQGLTAAGKAIDYSGSLVSQVLANKYAGDVGLVEEKVRGALLGLTVECPRLGEMTRSVCLEWQKKPLAHTSSLRVEMYHACRSGCPHSRLTGGTDDRK